MITYSILVRFRETDVGEVSEPEGRSSRNLPDSVTLAVIEHFNDTSFSLKIY